MPAGRTLHLVDIENLAGGCCSAAAVADAVAGYRSVVDVAADDHVIVGHGRRSAAHSAWAWPGARRVVRAGVDGADLALIEAERVADIAARYDRVVIGSGDHIFTALVWELRWAGVAVIVVAGVGSLSADLARAACLVRTFAPEPVAAA